MIRMQGKGVSRGAAQGPLFFLQRAESGAEKLSHRTPEEERARLDAAVAEASAQLKALAVHCRSEAGDEAALLFETHALFLADEDFAAALSAAIDAGAAAEHAAKAAGEQFAAMFSAMEDPYMQARAADIQDVARRIERCLTGHAQTFIEPDEPFILAADDLSPSETVQLSRAKLLGFATRFGSAASHTAILARTLGIPAVCGLGDALQPELSGKSACLDGESGSLFIDPDAQTKADFLNRQQLRRAERDALSSLAALEDVTMDGQRIDVCCNIGSPEDIPAVLANGARGVGLFRSEFLYLVADDFPSEEAQFRAYRDAAAAMEGRRVVIRTLDIGADKQAAYFHLPKEENPALGMRAVRICLSRPAVFRTQLRAIYRASAFGKIAILFPMIASVWEIRECRRACKSVTAELAREGVAFDPGVELGAMIETPASVLIAGELAREVDFFSVGTNDLTQYILACDRQNGDPGRFFDPRHPAVLRALKLAAEAAHSAGIPIGVCGDLASDPAMLETFLALGIHELSVAPADVLPLRKRIRASAAPAQ